MKLSEFKSALAHLNEVNFIMPDGQKVPAHFHVTEVGQVNKLFIDCGGTVRREKKVSFQLWEANDLDHRLTPEKLSNIIALSEKTLAVEDAEIEVEYQKETIGKYGLDLDGKNFLLTPTQTACLATDQCGIPPEKMKVKLSDLNTKSSNCCGPGSKCC